MKQSQEGLELMSPSCAFLAPILTTRFSPNYLQIRLCTKEVKFTAMDPLGGISPISGLLETWPFFRPTLPLGSTLPVAMGTSPIPQLLRWLTLALPSRTSSLLSPICFRAQGSREGRIFALFCLFK